MKVKLFPYPKKLELKNVYFGDGIFATADNPISDFLNDKNGIQIEYVKNDSIKREGYNLYIEERKITIEHSDKLGAFYGGLTLFKLKTLYGKKIPCMIVSDYPTISVRGVQICFGQFDVKWNPERMKKLLKNLVLSGVNEIYLYLEWNFYFKELPFLPQSGINESDMQEFVRLAERYGITVVPQVNLLGHSKEILDLEIMRDYKEGDSTFCPAQEKTVDLACKIIDKLCDIFPSKIIHVGGDEVGSYGNCEQCKEKKQNGGALSIFFDYFEKLNSRLKLRNRKIGLWSDQILKLLKDSRFWINTDQELQFYESNMRRLKNMADNLVVYNWWYNGAYDESSEFFTSNGIEHYACGSTNGYVSCGWDLSQINNLYNFYSHAERNGAKGQVTTDWMNVNGFIAEHCLLIMAAGVAMGWCGAKNGFTENQTLEEFLYLAATVYYGKPKQVLDYLLYSGTSGELFSGLPEKCKGLVLRNEMYLQLNPIAIYCLWGKDIYEYSEFEKRVEKALKLYNDAGKPEFLDIPIIAARFVLEKVKIFKCAFFYYNKAAKVQWDNKEMFEKNLNLCADKLEEFLYCYNEPKRYIKKVYIKTGSDFLADKRIDKQKQNLKSFIKYFP